MTENPETLADGPEEEREVIELSPRQQDLYDYLRSYIARNAIAPSRSEISAALGVKSPSAAELHLTALKKKGWIDIIPGTQRGIVLVNTGAVPLLYVHGHIGRETPLDPATDTVDRIPGALANRFRPRPSFCLQLGDYGLSIPGFRNGEIVAISTEKEIRDFDVAIARLNGMIQCRVFRRVDEDIVELIDVDEEDGAFANRINCRNHTLMIEGVVVGTVLGHPLPVMPWYQKVVAKLRKEAGSEEASSKALG